MGHLLFLPTQNLHNEVCGKRDKSEEVQKAAELCASSIKVRGPGWDVKFQEPHVFSLSY